MTLDTLFVRLGYSPLSARVYRTLESNGPLLITELSAHSGLHRPTLYRELARLLRAGIVTSFLRGKRTVYEAGERAHLQNLFSKEQSSATHMHTSETAVSQFGVKEIHLSGEAGIREAFNDVIDHLSRDDTFYRYTSEQDLDAVNAYLAPEYRKRRDQKRLERLVISSVPSASRKRSRLERFIKQMPETTGNFDQNIIQLIYGDRLSFIDLNSEKVLIIENRALAEFQKVIFRQLYKKL